jgi:hypothetical protein
VNALKRITACSFQILACTLVIIIIIIIIIIIFHVILRYIKLCVQKRTIVELRSIYPGISSSDTNIGSVFLPDRLYLPYIYVSVGACAVSTLRFVLCREVCPDAPGLGGVQGDVVEV